MRRTAKPPVVLGTVGLLLSALIFYLVFTKDIPLTRDFRVNAVFQDTIGLRIGSPVRIAGVDVGKVTELERGEGETAEVQMQVKDRGLPIHRDAQLRIRPRLFLEGGFYVELRPGSPSAPELEEDGTIPLPQTKIPVQFDQVLTTLDRSTRESLRTLVDQVGVALDGGGAKALRDVNRPLEGALRDTSILLEAARGTEPRDVSRLVAGAAKATTALASREGELRSLVTSFAQTTGALAAEGDAVGQGIVETDRVLRATPRAFDAFDATQPEVRRFSRDVRPSLERLPAVLDDTGALLTQLRGLSSARELPRAVALLRPSVQRLPTLAERLSTLFPLVTPVTDCVRDNALPVLTAEVPDGALSSGQPAWRDLLQAAVGLSSATQSFDGNGHFVRYLGGLGENTVQLNIPGFGPVAGLAGDVRGANPRWLGPGKTPPFRPDAECRDQPKVDLKARTFTGATAARVRSGSRPAPKAALAPGEVTRKGLSQLTTKVRAAVRKLEARR